MNAPGLVSDAPAKRDIPNARWAPGVLYVSMVLLFTAKVLWGYWGRDLTFGDTSSYFLNAIRWHQDGGVNIVWSPLYTAYYGSWLSVTENAGIATLLHRVGLVLVSTGLVAWLAYITLPRLLALLVVVWWVALPIHYDTLYEVHLFGALPIMVMALVALLAPDRWRDPVLLGTAVISAVLVRNEYVLAVGVLVAWSAFQWLRKGHSVSLSKLLAPSVRYGAVFLVAGIVIAQFYASSFVQGPAIRELSKPKHTLNMCQVFAYGYQQRHSDWAGSPWTECSHLMQTKFGMPQPSLRDMITSNPAEVFEHFAWNVSLTRAGIEVLLFNATSATDNPDYAPVVVIPVLPSALLLITLAIVSGGAVVIVRHPSAQLSQIRQNLSQMLPLMLAVLVMAVAVILTQRPRPSYLLGMGMLYMWVVAMMLAVLAVRVPALNSMRLTTLVAFTLVLVMPSYKSIPLPSKGGVLTVMYDELLPHASRLCQSNGDLAIGEYASELGNYLCAPYRLASQEFRGKILALSSMPEREFSTPQTLVDALNEAGVYALVIDPFLIQKHPGLRSCPDLRDALLNNGWEQLAYTIGEGGRCVAGYMRQNK